MPTSELPIDMSHPAVREYLALIRLQVLTPLSLLINIAAVIVCATVVKPTMGDISHDIYLTSITPKTGMIGAFIVVLYAAQIGYCILLVLARKTETKATLVKGVGISLVIANWIMALWAISWTLQIWVLTTILLGLLIIDLVYANVVLLIYHTPTSRRPLDTLFIHVPVRLFLLLPLNILFWQSLFITLGLYWDPGSPQRYTDYAWQGFGVVIATNVLALVVVFIRKDVVWCVGSAWLDASLWSERPKSVQVATTSTVFTILLPIVLIAIILWSTFKKKRQGAIVLPEDEAVVIEENETPNPNNNHSVQSPRQENRSSVWG